MRRVTEHRRAGEVADRALVVVLAAARDGLRPGSITADGLRRALGLE